MINPYDNYKPRAKVGKEVDWDGFYITSRRFFHLPYIQKYGHVRISEFNGEIQNIHTLFYKKFETKNIPVKAAKLFITGDDLYKLYVNSQFIGEGPAQSFPFAYNYNCYDVTDVISCGENSIGVHIYYQGLFNIYLVSADNLCGMICQLEITYVDGTVQKVVSDQSWKYSESDAIYSNETYGYFTGFNENIDLNKWNSRWHSINNNTDGWENALICGNPYPAHYNLFPQITPPVEFYKIKPQSVKKEENGYIIDFGNEYTGTLCMQVKGEKNQKINLRYAEELNPDGTLMYNIRANCNYDDIITLTGEERFIEYFDYKGFRYAEILNVPDDFNPDSVYIFCRNYPFPQNEAKFSCSEPLLEQIWDICYQAVKIGTQDTYYDCPTRERGGFIGDAYVTGISHLILTGDIRVFKKFISDIKNSAKYCPAIPCYTPTYNIGYIAEYSLIVPLFMEYYYNYTGDADFIKEVNFINKGILEYFLSFENNMGLLEGVQNMEKIPKETPGAVLIDWPPSLRDNYDYNESQTGVCTLLNMFYYGFLKSYSKLCEIVGQPETSQKLRVKYEELEQAIIKECFSKEKGLFLDVRGGKHASLHANILPLYFGISVPDGYDKIIALIKEKGLCCNLYFPYFLLDGLYKTDNSGIGYHLLTNKDECSWYNMIKEGASCCMETWSKTQKENISLCHPMTSTPIIIIKNNIMGIREDFSKENILTICPNIPNELKWMKIDIPFKDGRLKAEFSKENGKTIYTVSSPENVNIKFLGENIEFKQL